MNSAISYFDHDSEYCLEIGAMTSCGPRREENQDAIVVGGWVCQRPEAMSSRSVNIGAPFSVAVVDGMGGYEGGAEAACLAATALSKYDLDCNTPQEIDDFCNRLSDRIMQAGYAWGTPEMGTVFAMLTIAGDMFAVANVGDSRVYRYSATDDVMGLLTIDDRLAGGAGGVTQSLGGRAAHIDAHSFFDQIDRGSSFLLCTDGVWGTLGDDALQEIMGNGLTAESVVLEIKDRCYEKDALDNCSAVVVKFASLERPVIP